MKEKITLLDGAVGTELWAKAEKNGWKKEPVWKYNIDHPEIVAELAREYADAGSDIILSNTFGANAPSVQKSSSYSVSEVVSAGVKIAKEAVGGRGIRVGLDAGPLSELMEPYGDLTEEEVAEIYAEMFEAGVGAGADLIFLETFIDLAMLRVAAEEAKKYGVPVFCSLSFERLGKTMMGNSPEDMIEELEPLGVDAIGMNCSLGPELAVPIIRKFAGKTSLPLLFKPNAGLPVMKADGTVSTEYSAKAFVDGIAPALDFVDYIGGCCGSAPSYIRELAERIGKN
ncbi:MAG: homocysteine S-methyltransferase family protein [Clostridia bacterium]|nr:homocysteine S-methyltransferase family protein [Clostridia bacterium]MBQ3956838.1 homocysteine S-methyltransferase family protein [Clostridia bacterium]MBQ5354276.1 homocysteine S-methyltransferase family protein [Clostridia bacterium]